jgi:rhamnose utilization protein RhaD (predicted bifunctional aldolase and dehydrogenase)/NAD(P)-dependent dehydrogenase (short-subunit alcohol dehydrogenase family)
MTQSLGNRELPPEPTAILDELIEVARRYGEDESFSRAGGGNASAKAGGVLYIKPSGVPLAELTRDALVPLDMAALLALLAADGETDEPGTDAVMSVAREARLGEPGGRRPSVELLFHALMPERFVLHTHPIVLNAVTCNRDGAALATRLFGDRVLWIPYTTPGLPLARAIAAQRAAYESATGRTAPAITLMQNHGIIVAGDTAAEVEDRTGWVTGIVHAELDGIPALPAAPHRIGPDRARVLVDEIAPALRALLATGDGPRVVTFDGTPLAADFPATPAGRAFVEGGPMTPDQIVYAGSWPLLFDPPPDAGADAAPDAVQSALHARLDEHVAATGDRPVIVVVPGLGLFAAGDSWAEADTARHIYLDALRVGQGATRIGGIRPLQDAERSFIETWEAEAYRRGVAAGAGVPGRAAGKVVIVTGAAQGFGLAIAADLVAQGAHVVLADVNADLARAEAAGLEARFGQGRATALGMNVMDEASVADGIHAAVRRYGGLDLLVSNAGVLRAGGVTTQALADFDLVTRVNYRGYFLCVRSVAPVMARQHAARPGARWGDIIEINSKSGLVGSSRNSAYAGSKFGGIGLTQSFALELVGDGIKVNAICPGNFLDGPLWSDPDHGLFVQYLREGKVPGATTIDDVRHFYESRVPMGRGCSPADVLEALYYLVAQQYETGQALPVTGGQVMLS